MEICIWVDSKINDEGRKIFVSYSFFSTTTGFSTLDFISKLENWRKISTPP